MGKRAEESVRGVRKRPNQWLTECIQWTMKFTRRGRTSPAAQKTRSVVDKRARVRPLIIEIEAEEIHACLLCRGKAHPILPLLHPHTETPPEENSVNISKKTLINLCRC